MTRAYLPLLLLVAAAHPADAAVRYSTTTYEALVTPDMNLAYYFDLTAIGATSIHGIQFEFGNCGGHTFDAAACILTGTLLVKLGSARTLTNTARYGGHWTSLGGCNQPRAQPQRDSPSSGGRRPSLCHLHLRRRCLPAAAYILHSNSSPGYRGVLVSPLTEYSACDNRNNVYQLHAGRAAAPARCPSSWEPWVAP